MPGVEHVIDYHVITAGTCWAGIVDETPIRLETGDVIVFPHGDAHVLSSAPGYLSTLPADNVGWLAGLRDENVGRALGKLHQRPADGWTLEELAREVGVSRSVLAERFAHFVGVPPIQYLAQWRIQLASTLLSRRWVCRRSPLGSATAPRPR